jgi:hypothetical protein
MPVLTHWHERGFPPVFSVSHHIFLRQHYLYQVRRVKTLRFTLRLFSLPVFYANYTPNSDITQGKYCEFIVL